MRQHEWVVRLGGAVIALMAVAPVACNLDEEPDRSWPSSLEHEALAGSSASTVMSGSGGSNPVGSSSAGGPSGSGSGGSNPVGSASAGGPSGSGGSNPVGSGSGGNGGDGSGGDGSGGDGGTGGTGGFGGGGAGGGTGGVGGIGGFGGGGAGGGTGGQGGTGGVKICIDGTTCKHPDPCVLAATCVNGMCMATTSCADQNPQLAPCQQSVCMQGVGCQTINLTGPSCDDNNACTTVDQCQAGMCMGGTPTTCPDMDCKVSFGCDPSSGMCIYADEIDNTPCEDGSACTELDTCQSGACQSGTPVTCTSGNTCLDAVCNPVTGCTYPPKMNGTLCGGAGTCTGPGMCMAGSCQASPDPAGTSCSDGNDCTENDTCDGAGFCKGVAKVCEPTQCETDSVCNPATGLCQASNKPENTPCDDDSVCTEFDACSAGQCVPGTPIFCAPPGPCFENMGCDPVNGCVFVPKQDMTPCGGMMADCYEMGTCSGGVCNAPLKPQGSSCDDLNPCTLNDVCDVGVCKGALIDCPTDACDEGASCNPQTGLCKYAPKPNGTVCDDSDLCTLADTCLDGDCNGMSPVQCDEPMPCREPGMCNPATGTCSSAVSPNGTACATSPVDCKSTGECQDGICNGVPDPDTTPCDDGKDCTNSDQCLSGTCVGNTSLDGVPCPGGVCIAGSCFPEPMTGGGGAAGGGGGGAGGSAQGGGGGSSQGGGGAGGLASNPDEKVRLHGGACGVVKSPGIQDGASGAGGALGAMLSGVGLLAALVARRRRRATSS